MSLPREILSPYSLEPERHGRKIDFWAPPMGCQCAPYREASRPSGFLLFHHCEQTCTCIYLEQQTIASGACQQVYICVFLRDLFPSHPWFTFSRQRQDKSGKNRDLEASLKQLVPPTPNPALSTPRGAASMPNLVSSVSAVHLQQTSRSAALLGSMAEPSLSITRQSLDRALSLTQLWRSRPSQRPVSVIEPNVPLSLNILKLLEAAASLAGPMQASQWGTQSRLRPALTGLQEIDRLGMIPPLALLAVSPRL